MRSKRQVCGNRRMRCALSISGQGFARIASSLCLGWAVTFTSCTSEKPVPEESARAPATSFPSKPDTAIKEPKEGNPLSPTPNVSTTAKDTASPVDSPAASPSASPSPAPQEPSLHSIGGTVQGLGAGKDLVLGLLSENLTVNANGTFTFVTPLLADVPYSVVVSAQPAHQTCFVSGASGVISDTAVLNLAVTCSDNPSYKVGGTVSNLGGTVVLQTGSREKSATSSGSFQFTEAFYLDETYNVSVKTQPSAYEACSVTNGSGTLANSDVNNISVTCTATHYRIGGTVTGLLSNSSLVLELNGDEQRTVTGNGTFEFPSHLLVGSAFSVLVDSQPLGQSCTLSGGSGNVAAESNSSVEISCTPVNYPVEGTVSGLPSGGQLGMKLNGGNTFNITANGSTTFASAIPFRQALSLQTVSLSQGVSCAITDVPAIQPVGGVNTISVSCSMNSHPLGGTLSGLAAGKSLTLRNMAEDLMKTSNGAFVFPTGILYDQNFAVTVLTQPSHQTCMVTNGSGTMPDAAVTNIGVNCSDDPTFPVGGNISGLVGSVVLQSGTLEKTISSNGAFQFDQQFYEGDSYNVLVKTHPAQPQTCLVSNGSGTVATASVQNISVNCTTDSYLVGGTVSGILPGNSVTLRLNSTENLALSSSNNTFQFTSSVSGTTNFSVSILSSPSDQSCSLANSSSSTPPVQNVSSLHLTCQPGSISWGSNPTLNNACLAEIPGAASLGSGVTATYSGTLAGSSGSVASGGVSGTSTGFSATLTNLTRQNIDSTWQAQFSNPSGNLSIARVLRIVSQNTTELLQGSPSATIGLNRSSGTELPRAGCGASCASGAKGSVTVGDGVCVITSDSKAKCWGGAPFGQFSDGYTSAQTFPANVSGLTANVTAIATGQSATCAAHSGAVKCWGARNEQSQLGISNTTIRLESPTAIASLSSGITDVSIAARHACALKSGGTIACWGLNNVGQFGNSTTDNTGTSTPTDISGLSNVVEVKTGYAFTCVRLSSASGSPSTNVRCAGANSSGQLGNGGSGSTQSTPVNVNLAVTFTAIDAGDLHACGITGAEYLRCWGQNTFGQSGQSGTGNVTSPNVVNKAGAVGFQVTKIGLGGNSSCAVEKTTGAAYCWGQNNYGQLGNGNTTNSSVPALVSELSSGVSAIDVGHSFACALKTDSTVWCWGRNNFGQLGRGSAGSPSLVNSSTPVQVTGITTATQIKVGPQHACAVLSSGALQCWGQNGSSLGLGTLGAASASSPVVPYNISAGSDFSNLSQVAFGEDNGCFLGTDGKVFCSGSTALHNVVKQNTATSWSDESFAQEVTGLPTAGGIKASQIELGQEHACALMDDGSVSCWGNGGRLGNGTSTGTDQSTTTYSLAKFDSTNNVTGAVEIATGRAHTCALTSAGKVFCWGPYSGTTNNPLGAGDTPVATYANEVKISAGVSLSGITHIAASRVSDSTYLGHTCAINASGQVYCWGVNTSGQIGDGTTTYRNFATLVSGISSAVGLALGKGHSCALLSDQTVKCWGQNDFGQLGDNSTNTRSSPVSVLGISTAISISAGRETTCALLASGKLKCWGQSKFGQSGTQTNSVPNPTGASLIDISNPQFQSNCTKAAIEIVN